MNKSDPRPQDPFTGMTDAATDQQLFAAPPKSKKKTDPDQFSKARLQEKKKASLEERNHTSKKESKHPSFQSFLRPHLDMKATTIVSFRYPEELVDQIEECKYTIKKQYKTKTTKNAILITALAFILWDFEQHGKDSVIKKNLLEQQK